MESQQDRRFTVPVNEELIERIERLVAIEELGFTSVQHFLGAAIHSFVAYKERQVASLRRDAEVHR